MPPDLISLYDDAGVIGAMSGHKTVDYSNAEFIVPAGSTTADVQIKEALDALPNGGIVHVNHGHYKKSKENELLVDGTIIEGEGIATIIENESTTGEHTFTVNKVEATVLRNCAIKDMHIVGNPQSGDALHLKGFARQSRVENVFILGGARGVYLEWSWSSLWKNVEVRNVEGDGFVASTFANHQLNLSHVSVINAGARGFFFDAGAGLIGNGLNASVCEGVGMQFEWGLGKQLNSLYFESNGGGDILIGDGTGGSASSGISINDTYHHMNSPTYGAGNRPAIGIHVNDGENVVINKPVFTESSTSTRAYGTYIQVDAPANNTYLNINSNTANKVTDNSTSTLIVTDNVPN